MTANTGSFSLVHSASQGGQAHPHTVDTSLIIDVYSDKDKGTILLHLFIYKYFPFYYKHKLYLIDKLFKPSLDIK